MQTIQSISHADIFEKWPITAGPFIKGMTAKEIHQNGVGSYQPHKEGSFMCLYW